MTAKKLFYGLVGSIGLLVVIIGLTVFYGNQMLIKQNNKLAEAKVQVANLDLVQSSLVTAKRDIEQYSTIEQIAKTVVPQEKDQAKTVREIVKIANELGISISSIGFASSSLGTTGKATTPAAASAGNTSTTTQTEKVEGLTGVEKLPITVTSDSNKPVSYKSFLLFLERLEQNRRTSQVADVNIQPNADNRNFINFSLKLNAYIKK